MGSERLHIFISHHHKDDEQVTKMKKLLNDKGYDVRNSSIRAKPANQEKLNRGLVKEETIRRLLRMKISWAKAVVVLIGKDTHTRPWVDWEIKQAQKQGKRIVGVYERGGTDADIPEPLKKYANSIVAWNAESIIGAIEGTAPSFQTEAGGDLLPVNKRVVSTC
jgi:hypothetical protein